MNNGQYISEIAGRLSQGNRTEGFTVLSVKEPIRLGEWRKIRAFSGLLAYNPTRSSHVRHSLRRPSCKFGASGPLHIAEAFRCTAEAIVLSSGTSTALATCAASKRPVERFKSLSSISFKAGDDRMDYAVRKGVETPLWCCRRAPPREMRISESLFRSRVAVINRSCQLCCDPRPEYSSGHVMDHHQSGPSKNEAERRTGKPSPMRADCTSKQESGLDFQAALASSSECFHGEICLNHSGIPSLSRHSSHMTGSAWPLSIICWGERPSNTGSGVLSHSSFFSSITNSAIKDCRSSSSMAGTSQNRLSIYSRS